MYLKEIDINARNWVGLVQDRDYWRVQWGIEPPGFISHVVSLIVILLVSCNWEFCVGYVGGEERTGHVISLEKNVCLATMSSIVKPGEGKANR